jgi:hypothetical protein
MSTCAKIRTSLGVYVLGSIEPAERGRVDTHLTSCPHCRDELAGLAGLPALLGRVSEEQIDEVAGPPEELLGAVLHEVAAERSERRRRRRWVSLATAAAVVSITFGGAVLGGTLNDPGPTRPPAAAEQVSGTDPITHVSARIGLDRRDWGTAVTVRLKNAPPKARCRLIAVSRDGRRDVAASWEVEYEGYADFFGSTMIPREQLTSFEVVTMEGRRLLTLPA